MRDETDNAQVERCVIPAGGRRAFIFNGRHYRLTLRRTMLLLYHDSETMGPIAVLATHIRKCQSLSGGLQWKEMCVHGYLVVQSADS